MRIWINEQLRRRFELQEREKREEENTRKHEEEERIKYQTEWDNLGMEEGWGLQAGEEWIQHSKRMFEEAEWGAKYKNKAKEANKQTQILNEGRKKWGQKDEKC
jgi:hypothetical protein